jgi:hypothetical protein
MLQNETEILVSEALNNDSCSECVKLDVKHHIKETICNSN